jgi:hypothetical protein
MSSTSIQQWGLALSDEGVARDSGGTAIRIEKSHRIVPRARRRLFWARPLMEPSLPPRTLGGLDK